MYTASDVKELLRAANERPDAESWEKLAGAAKSVQSRVALLKAAFPVNGETPILDLQSFVRSPNQPDAGKLFKLVSELTFRRPSDPTDLRDQMRSELLPALCERMLKLEPSGSDFRPQLTAQNIATGIDNLLYDCPESEIDDALGESVLKKAQDFWVTSESTCFYRAVAAILRSPRVAAKIGEGALKLLQFPPAAPTHFEGRNAARIAVGLGRAGFDVLSACAKWLTSRAADDEPTDEDVDREVEMFAFAALSDRKSCQRSEFALRLTQKAKEWLRMAPTTPFVSAQRQDGKPLKCCIAVDVMLQRCVETGSYVKAYWLGDCTPRVSDVAILQYIVDLLRFGFRSDVAVEMAQEEKRAVMVDFPDSAEFAEYTIRSALRSGYGLSDLLTDTAISQINIQRNERPDLDLLTVYQLMVLAEVKETQLWLTCGVPGRCYGTLIGDAAIRFLSGDDSALVKTLTENQVRVVVHSSDEAGRDDSLQVALESFRQSLPAGARLFAHGTTRASALGIVREGIQLDECRQKADFGQAFYLTPIANLCDAVDFASIAVNRSFTTIRPAPPECAVLVYAQNEEPSADVTHLSFDDDGHPWKRAVLSFRRKKPAEEFKYLQRLRALGSMEGPVAATTDDWKSEDNLHWRHSDHGTHRMWQLALRTPEAVSTITLVGLFVFPRGRV